MATNRRILKINKTLMKELSNIIQTEVKDPRLVSMVTVVDVSMSPDMRNVTVVVSLFSQNEMDNLKSMEALNAASGFISSTVSHELRLKWAPEIKFERTHSIEEGVSMYFKLKELTKNENESGASEAEESGK